MGMQLTAGQKQSYADDRFLIVRDVFAAAELERLERGAVAAVQYHLASSGPGASIGIDRGWRRIP
jgi:hypothetical protein